MREKVRKFSGRRNNSNMILEKKNIKVIFCSFSMIMGMKTNIDSKNLDFDPTLDLSKFLIGRRYRYLVV